MVRLKDISRIARESNLIEAIDDEDKDKELFDLMARFNQLDVVTVSDVIQFAESLGGKLRDKPGMNVRVGNHTPIGGGPQVIKSLEDIAPMINSADPYLYHHEFESLHPFTDGNGRTGRAIWVWQMLSQGRDLSLGFLHLWYYQSLSEAR